MHKEIQRSEHVSNQELVRTNRVQIEIQSPFVSHRVGGDWRHLADELQILNSLNCIVKLRFRYNKNGCRRILTFVHIFCLSQTHFWLFGFFLVALLSDCSDWTVSSDDHISRRHPRTDDDASHCSSIPSCRHHREFQKQKQTKGFCFFCNNLWSFLSWWWWWRSVFVCVCVSVCVSVFDAATAAPDPDRNLNLVIWCIRFCHREHIFVSNSELMTRFTVAEASSSCLWTMPRPTDHDIVSCTFEVFFAGGCCQSISVWILMTVKPV